MNVDLEPKIVRITPDIWRAILGKSRSSDEIPDDVLRKVLDMKPRENGGISHSRYKGIKGRPEPRVIWVTPDVWTRLKARAEAFESPTTTLRKIFGLETDKRKLVKV